MEIFTPKPKAQKRFEVKVPDPYKFLRTLGQGRFGSVHEVSKPPSDEHFAMKVLPFTCEADFKKNEHEISKLKDIKHRNVVDFVEAIEGDNTHFVVLELCSHSLQDEISEHKKLGGKMDVVRVYRVMRDVLGGLVYLHSRGQIYGDLKGPNVLIGKDGTAKLGDFGGVVGVGTMITSNPAECGTMQYWAPEFFKLTMQSDSQIGSSAGDMWAFGLLLLEMLTGRSWIVGRCSVEIERSVLGFDIDRMCESEGIVGEVQVLLSLLLSDNPSQRISSAELIRSNRLQSILHQETPLSRFYAEKLAATRIKLHDALHATATEHEALLKEQEAMIQLQQALLNEQEQHVKAQHRLSQQEQEHQTDKIRILSLEKAHFELQMQLSNTHEQLIQHQQALHKEQEEHRITKQLLNQQIQPRPTNTTNRSSSNPLPAVPTIENQRQPIVDVTPNPFRPTSSITWSSKVESQVPAVDWQRLQQLHLKSDRFNLSPKEEEYFFSLPVRHILNPVVVTPRDVPNYVQSTLSSNPKFICQDPSHFRVDSNIITRTDVGCSPSGTSMFSSLFLADVFRNGVISVDFTIISLIDNGGIFFGLVDSTSPLPKTHEAVGCDVKNSVSLDKFGRLDLNTPLSDSFEECHNHLKEGDCVRMEVDLDSTPRTVRFFVNSEAGECYMSGIPSSVRIGLLDLYTLPMLGCINFLKPYTWNTDQSEQDQLKIRLNSLVERILPFHSSYDPTLISQGKSSTKGKGKKGSKTVEQSKLPDSKPEPTAKKKSTAEKSKKKAPSTTAQSKVEVFDEETDTYPEQANFPEFFLLITQFPTDLNALFTLEQLLEAKGLSIGAVINIHSVPVVSDEYLNRLPYSFSASLLPPTPVPSDPTQEKKKDKKAIEPEKKAEKAKSKQSESGTDPEYFLSEAGQKLLDLDIQHDELVGESILKTISSTVDRAPLVSLYQQIHLIKSSLPTSTASFLHMTFIFDLCLREILSGTPLISSDLKLPVQTETDVSPSGESTQKVPTPDFNPESTSKVPTSSPQPKSKLSKSSVAEKQPTPETVAGEQPARIDALQLLFQLSSPFPALSDPPFGNSSIAAPQPILYRRKTGLQLLTEVHQLLCPKLLLKLESDDVQTESSTLMQNLIQEKEKASLDRLEHLRTLVFSEILENHRQKAENPDDMDDAEEEAKAKEETEKDIRIINSDLPLNHFLWSDSGRTVLSTEQLSGTEKPKDESTEQAEEGKVKGTKGTKGEGKGKKRGKSAEPKGEAKSEGKPKEKKERPPTGDKKKRRSRPTTPSEPPLTPTTQPDDSSELTQQPPPSTESQLSGEFCADLQTYRAVSRTTEQQLVQNVKKPGEKSDPTSTLPLRTDAAGHDDWFATRKVDEAQRQATPFQELFGVVPKLPQREFEMEEGLVLDSIIKSVSKTASSVSDRQSRDSKLRETTRSSFERGMSASGRRSSSAARSSSTTTEPASSRSTTSSNNHFRQTMLNAISNRTVPPEAAPKPKESITRPMFLSRGGQNRSNASSTASLAQSEEKMEMARQFFISDAPRLLDTKQTMIVPSFGRSLKMPPTFFNLVISPSPADKALPAPLISLAELIRKSSSAPLGQPTPPKSTEAASFTAAFHNPHAFPALVVSGKFTKPKHQATLAPMAALVLNSRRSFYTASSNNAVFFKQKKTEDVAVPLAILCSLPSSSDMQLNISPGASNTSVFPSLSHLTRSIEYAFSAFQSSFHSARFKREDDVRKKTEQVIEALSTLPSYLSTVNEELKQAAVTTPNGKDKTKKRRLSARNSQRQVQQEMIARNEALIVHGPGLLASNLTDACVPLLSPFTFHAHTAAVFVAGKSLFDGKAKKLGVLRDSGAFPNTLTLSNGVSFILPPGISSSRGMNSNTFLGILQLPPLVSKVPSPLSILIAQNSTQTSLKSAILNFAEAVRLVSIDSATITEAQQKLFPHSIQPPDMLTLADIDGDFAEGRDFFSRISERDLSAVLREQDLMHSSSGRIGGGVKSAMARYFGEVYSGPEDDEERENMGVLDDMFLHLLLCASFSEMLTKQADPTHHTFASSSTSTLLGGTFVAPEFFSKFYPSSNTAQTAAAFIPSTPVARNMRESTAEKNEIQQFSFSNPSIQITLPSRNEQTNRTTLGSFLFVSEKEKEQEEVVEQFLSPPLTAASRSRRSPSTIQNRAVSPLRSSQTRPNIRFTPFGMGERWDGKPNTASIYDTPEKSTKAKRGGPNSTAKRSRLAETPTEAPTDRQNDTNFKQLRAIYAPPLVDSAEYAVTEEYTQEALSLAMSRLLINDFPVRTQFFAPEDSVLVAIGCVQEKEGIGGIDRTYWVKRASPTAAEVKKRMKTRFSSYLTTVTQSPPSSLSVLLSPSLLDTSNPLNEQFATFSNPRQQVFIKQTVERVGASIETSVSAFHRRGHTFSMRRRARLQIGLQPPTDIPLSADTLAMFSNPDEGQQAATLSPTLLSFALSLREILESVPLASVGTAYQIAVNDLRRAEREINQNKEREQANPSQGDQLEQVKSSAQTHFMSNREYLAISLRGPHKDRLVSAFHRFGIPFEMAPSPIDNTSPLSVVLSPLLSSVHSYFKQETVSSHLLPALSSQIKSLAYQITSIQNHSFDVSSALAQVKQTIANQMSPAAGEDIFRSQYASSQLHASHIAKLVVTADVQYLHTRLMRNPLRSLFMSVFRDALLPASHSLTVRQSVISHIPSYSLNSSSPASIVSGNAFHEDTLPSPTAPVHFEYVSTPSFTSTFSDKTTVSMKTHKSDNPDSIPYDVTYSTVGGQVVSIDSETGTVRVTAAPIAGEGTEQTGRGFGHLLMPDRTAISTQTLLDHRHKSCQAFVEAARAFSIEQGKDGILRYRNGEKVCGMQIPVEEEAEDDDPKAKKGKKAKAKKTEPAPIAPKTAKTSRKGRNRATAEETVDNPFETTTEEEQEVFRRVFTAHFTRILHSADPASISKTSSSNTLHKGVSTTTQPSKQRLSRGATWTLPEELHRFTTPLPEMRVCEPVYECTRSVSGMGTTSVKMSSGEVAVLLANGDVSLCDGNEWMSVNSKGERVARPLFSFPLLPPDLDFSESDDPDIILLRDCFKDVSLPSDLPIDQAAEEGSTIAKPQTREEDDAPTRLGDEADESDEERSQRSLQTLPHKLNTITQHLPAFFPLPASSTLNQFALPPIRSVEAINSDETASVRTRADRVTIVQHNTGERVVHHADGTRVFHSFAFGDSPKLVEKYEQETESLAPMKAMLCVEHPNSPRILISLVQKKIGSFLNQFNRSEDIASSIQGTRLNETPTMNWVREMVTVCLCDGTTLEWSSAEKKIVITKPDNTHIHFTPVGNVSVYCEHPTKKPAAKFGPPTRLPLLFFKTTDGSMTVRPSKRATPILSGVTTNPSFSSTSSNDQRPSSATSSSSSHASLLLSPVLKASSSIPVAPVVTEVTEAYASKRPQTARRVFFTALDGTACWVTARTMKNATPPKRVPGAFFPSLFGQKGIGVDLTLEPQEKDATETTLIDSVLAMPGIEDRDSVDYMEKKLKEMKLKKERIAEQEIDEARKAKRKAAQLARASSITPAQTPKATPPIKPTVTPFSELSQDDEPDKKQNIDPRTSAITAELEISTQRWIARLSALHAHQIQLAQDTLVTTSKQIGQTSLASLQTSPFILPRLFVIRHNGTGFELLRRKAVSRLYPRPTDAQSRTSPIFTNSTSLLKPTANHKPVKVPRQSRLLSHASLIALTPSPRPSPSNGASSDRQTQEKTGVISAQHSTDDLHSQNPLFAYSSPYSDVQNLFYDLLSAVSSDRKRVASEQESMPYTPSPKSPDFASPALSLNTSLILDEGVLEDAFAMKRPTHPQLLQLDQSDAFPLPKSSIHADSFVLTDIPNLLQRTQEPLPALLGHGEAGLQLSLQQFSSILPTEMTQSISGQNLIDVKMERRAPQPESRLSQSSTQQHANISTFNPILTDFSRRVNFFPPSKKLPPGTLISPSRPNWAHIQTPNAHRMPFSHLLESSHQKKKVGLSSMSSKKQSSASPKIKHKLDEAILRSPIVKSMPRKLTPVTSFSRPKSRHSATSTTLSSDVVETKKGPLDVKDEAPTKPKFSPDSFVFADRRETERGVTICLPLVKVEEVSSPERRAMEIAQNANPFADGQPAPKTRSHPLIPPSSSVQHISIQHCPQTLGNPPCGCNPTREEKPAPIETVPSANLFCVTTDPNPPWSPYLPELLRFEPLTIREHFLPPHVHELNLPPTEFNQILNGEKKIPLPPALDPHTKPAQSTLIMTKLVEHPPPPPLLVLLVYEFLVVLEFVSQLRGFKALNRMNLALDAFVDKLWSSFGESVGWVGESVLHERLKSSMLVQLQRLLGLGMGKSVGKKEDKKEEKKGKNAKSAPEPEQDDAPQTPPSLSATSVGNFNSPKAVQGKNTLTPLAVALQQIPSLSKTRLKNDDLYPLALNVLFEKKPLLKAIQKGVQAEEWIVTELLSGGWRKKGTRESFVVPFTSFQQSSWFQTSCVHSFGGLLEITDAVKSLYPVQSSHSKPPTNLPILFSTLPTPPVRRTQQPSSSTQAKPTDAQKSQQLADKLFVRNVVVIRHEREKTLLNQEVSRRADWGATLTNEIQIESKVSRAASRADLGVDGYGGFERLIENELREIKDRHSSAKDNKASKTPHQRSMSVWDNVRGGMQRQGSFVMPNARAKKKELGVPRTPSGFINTGKQSFESIPQSSPISEKDEEKDVFSGDDLDDQISLEIDVTSDSDSNTEKHKITEIPEPGRVLSYFDSVEGRQFRGGDPTDNKRPLTSGGSIVERVKMEQSARAFPPPDMAGSLRETRKSAKRKEVRGVGEVPSTPTTTAHVSMRQFVPRTLSVSPPPESALREEQRQLDGMTERGGKKRAGFDPTKRRPLTTQTRVLPSGTRTGMMSRGIGSATNATRQVKQTKGQS
ncbi:putative Mitogen-activated protein kinase kinase kinase 5 [Blattamonas nauphoetae]|uniref:Mitogen-activated protein kinase kinase kinase 5 n=1 Tax=Blattamonas nauphoetae TaxID=2049346 RepID=A0ABQ9XIX3_9EUKA|nr:putative Mitogen-activated protein kinase kinase kinase 5 [Blattamonas nauphoetae]